MSDGAFILAGAMVGASVAVPVGPMGVLCISRTLSGGMAAGVSTGVGASTVHAAYCALLLLGMQQAGPWLDGHGQVLGALAGALMLVFAWRVLRRRLTRATSQRASCRSLLEAYGTAVAFNLCNPLTVVLLAASVAAFAGPVAPVGDDAAWLLGGLFAGSAAWWLCLSGAAAMLRARLDQRMLGMVNVAAAAALAGSGLAMLARVGLGAV